MIGAGRLDEGKTLRRGVEEVRFEAVDNFENEVDPRPLRDVGGLGDGRDAVLPAAVGWSAKYFV